MLTEIKPTFNEIIYDLQYRRSEYEGRDISSPDVVGILWNSDIILRMEMGSKRRQLLKQILEVRDIRLDARWCRQLKLDKDIQKLIKSGEYYVRKERIWFNCTRKFLTKVKVS